MRIDPKDLDALLSLKIKMPQTVGDIKRIIGFLSYYRSYFQDFSGIAKPLYELLQVKSGMPQVQPHREKTKGPKLSSRTPVDWTGEHQSTLVVCATWEGNQAAQRKDVAWIAALHISSVDSSQQPSALLPIIGHDELVKAQRKDPAIGEIVQLKETATVLADEMREVVNSVTRKMFYEWSKLNLENGLRYRRTNERQHLVLPVKYRPGSP